MKNIYPEFTLCGSKNVCARTDIVFSPISEVSEDTVSLGESQFGGLCLMKDAPYFVHMIKNKVCFQLGGLCKGVEIALGGLSSMRLSCLVSSTG